MKYTPIILAIILIATSGSIACAEKSQADINSNIRTEFADDLPKTYGQAITDLRKGTNVNVLTKSPENTDPTQATHTQSPDGVVFTHIDSTADYVRVVYTGHAKLFGFLPVPVAVEVAVYADGSTRVALPWYRFLLSYDDVATVEDSLQKKIRETTSLPSPNGIISEEVQQSILNVFGSELRAHFTK